MSHAAEPLDAWAGRSLESLRSAWAIPQLHAFARVGSTNDIARQLATSGAPQMTTVIAEHQTAGRGRFGRTWTAPPGSALLMSVVLRPAGGPRAAPSATPLRVGLAVARAIERTTHVVTRLKWPNDILADDGRKIAGVLCEAATTGGTAFVIAGIGINTDHSAADWPTELRDTAASLRILTGTPADRVALAGTILDHLATALPFMDHPLSPGERDDWLRRDALRDCPVHVDGEAAGTADGVTPQGALRLRTSRGPRLLWSGTVRPGANTPAGDPP